MKRRTRTILKVLFFLLGISGGVPLAGGQRASPPRKVHGVILDAQTGKPIAGARVFLSQDLEPLPGATAAATGKVVICTTCGGAVYPADAGTLAISDTDGRFEFDNLEARKFSVSAERNGYENGQSDALRWEMEASLPNVVLRLIPTRSVTATVGGRVRNAKTGRPSPDIEVTLYRREYSQEGEETFEEVEKARTNDLGDYRMYWIKPGRYYVGIEEDENYSRRKSSIETTYLPTFFPGVPQINRASTITLRAGNDVTGIDFALEPQRLFGIRGHIVDPGTKAAADGDGLVVSVSGSWGRASRTRTVQAARSGEFEIEDLPPGSYEIAVRPYRGKRDEIHVTPASLVIADTDIDGLALTLAEPEPPTEDSTREHPISGRVTLEGKLKEGWTLKDIGIRFYGASLSTSTAADGTFTFEGVSGEVARIRLYWIPNGCYIKQATLDGRDILTQPLSLENGNNLEIVLSSAVGKLDGVARNSRQEPFPEAHVVLVPDSRERTALFRSSTADQAGRFQLKDVPPGRYKLFAWDVLEHHEYFDPAVLQRFEERGIPIDVTESSQQNRDVIVFPMEDAP